MFPYKAIFALLPDTLSVFKFFYYSYNLRYTHALAAISELKHFQKPLMPYILWANYQLRMYKNVRDLNYSGNHWRGLFSNIASNLALGDQRLALANLDSFIQSKPSNERRYQLARSIAQFNTELALVALNSISRKSINLYWIKKYTNDYVKYNLLRVALLLKLDQKNQAVSKLNGLSQTHMKKKSVNKKLLAEYHLININAFNLDPIAQLRHINACLDCYGLSRLDLKNKNESPNATNLIVKNSVNCHLTPYPNDMPLVSILMTTFNSVAFVKNAVESLLNQTYKNIEIIIVDDASSDNTYEFLQTLAKQYQNIRVYKLLINAGTYVAKTVALGHANGEFITCQDSDDWSHPERIERQMAPLLNNPNVVVTTSNWVRIQENGELYARGVFPLVGFNPASPLFRKSKVLSKTGMWDLVKTGGDSEFIARLKLVFGRNSEVRIPEPLCFGAHRAGSLMTSKSTGYSENSINHERSNYLLDWGTWHIASIKEHQTPYIKPLMHFERSFKTSEKLEVSLTEIRQCIKYN